MASRTSLNSWKELETHAKQIKDRHMRDLFAEDKQRFEHFSVKLNRFLIDYSKNLITQETMDKLLALAQETEVESWRDAMFSGDRINKTENRAVLHASLRNRSKTPVYLDGENVTEQVEQELTRMEAFVSQVRRGDWRGYTGKPIRDIVNLGVGGSNLGPQMVTEALKNLSDHSVRTHYVSNVDGTQIAEVLRPLNPETVLFIVSSKSFSTTETLTNAQTAMRWLVSAAFDDKAISKHFVAVTAKPDKAQEYGFHPDNIFRMWNWVGGRFSLWSAIGLPIALEFGFEKFIELLEGAHEMDKHFQSAPLDKNAPVLMALIAVWNTTFLGCQSHAILPYDQTLHMLAAYLQQAEMESNGKSVTWNGEAVTYPTVASIWGGLGINGQHAFYQYLHQSKNIVPADFIGSIESATPVKGHHETLMANFFAQTQALMCGVNEEQVRADLTVKGRQPGFIDQLAPHKVHSGNRPTNTILLKKLDSWTLGALIAMYEHKIFVQGILLQICSFDQWGVELGKGLAEKIQVELTEGQANVEHDSSTLHLMEYYKRNKQD
ncbi:glucose-6-phosphate isomerase [Aliikangiella coralliicola]|uniref:Glucose-6-phosphate isomerase n=1 Tax=Aliikangiella coralliicola TaxID=2592383 RepID=A0A545UHI7_9GAMM|nr:glucose-6-phosphate isomerase [Aliikangiella coralliicola]TQV88936.1 glucose-6-phosphate isomerase [Aliikangiella coralliicola]